MSDPTSSARTARESLAKGLSALQADPNVPKHLMDQAALIAQAMGALMQIEKTNGAKLIPYAEVALTAVRTVLANLQTMPTSIPAVAAAMESVAESLGVTHTLAKLAGADSVKPPPQPSHFPGPARAVQQAFVPPPQRVPVIHNAPDIVEAPPPAAGRAQPAMKPLTPSVPVPAPPAGDLPVVHADLGAHSVTNFYKGLSGNDIVDHGGIFIATYMIPKLGSRIRLKVALPGGFEFEANGVVKWARQLVYRYVRNREPLFYDDL